MNELQSRALTSRAVSARYCPFINKPFSDCSCLDMDSQKTIAVLHYCRDNYKDCEIYQKRRAET